MLHKEIVYSKLNMQSMERPERNARDAAHVSASQEDKAKGRGGETLDETTEHS